jgi:hypothetical protein
MLFGGLVFRKELRELREGEFLVSSTRAGSYNAKSIAVLRVE